MRFRTRHLTAVVLVALAPGASLAAQARPDSTHTWLVGRHETARIIFEPTALPDDLLAAATGGGSGRVAIDRPVARLATDLPLHVGEGLLAPGNYTVRIRFEGATPQLVVEPADAPGTAPSAQDGTVTTMQFPGVGAARRVAEPVVRIETLRLDTDTLSFVDRSTPQMTITEIQMMPATTSELVVLLGRWSWHVPVRAR